MLAISSLLRRLTNQRGTTMAEFGLVALPALVLFFAIMNFAMALYAYDFVGYSAQQGARYAMVHGSTATTVVTAANVQTYVTGLVMGALDTTQLTVTTTWSPNNQPGGVVTVRVAYTYKPFTSLVSTVNLSFSQTAALVISR